MAVTYSITDALVNGKTRVKTNINLRYETVNQDNALKNPDALTLRTRSTYATGSVSGFYFLVEVKTLKRHLELIIL